MLSCKRKATENKKMIVRIIFYWVFAMLFMIKDQILRLFDVNYCKLLVQSTNKYDHLQRVFLLPNLNEYYIK